MAKKLVVLLWLGIIFGLTGPNISWAATPTGSVGPEKTYEEESKQDCGVGEGAGTNTVPMYKVDDKNTTFEMRPDAGLNFAATAKGVSCGQVKSDPVVLSEEISYDPFRSPICDSGHNWTGNLTIDGVNTPFAKQIADHWAGTFNSEIQDDKVIDDLRKRAKDGDIGAQKQILEQSGVLARLLPRGGQDVLRAAFVDYVRKTGESMYSGFTIDGILVSTIPPPPKAPTDQSAETVASYQAAKDEWESKWRKTFDKLPLVPNEQTWGQVKLVVCSDKEYRIYPRYQELMRAGLAGNEIFKVMASKDQQSKYYDQNAEMKEPLKGVLTKAETKSVTAMKTAEQVPIVSAKVSSKPNILARISGWLSAVVPKVKAVLAGDLGLRNLIAIGPNVDKLITQLTVNVVNGKIEYKIMMVNNIGAGDFSADLYVNGAKLAHIGGPNNILPGGSLSFGSPGSGANFSEGNFALPLTAGQQNISVVVKYNGKSSEGNESVQSCAVSFDGSQATSACSAGTPPPLPEAACDGSKSCCGKETKDSCTTACTVCATAQSGPPYTLESGGGSSKTVSVGVVNYTFLKPDYREYANGQGIPDCTAVLPPVNQRVGCSRNADCAGWGTDEVCKGGFCAAVTSCIKTHDRVVSVYNNAPYLYSLWEQSAGAGGSENDAAGGFLNLFKPGATAASPELLASFKAGPLGPGCSAKFTDVFAYDDKTQQWYYRPVAGAAEVSYKFALTGATGVNDVKMTSADKQKLLFYRLGGVCNADKWVSQKELNPLAGQ